MSTSILSKAEVLSVNTSINKQRGAIAPLALIIIIIAVLVVVGFIYISQSKSKKINEPQSTDAATESSYLKEEYQNPFEEKSQYQNPFSEDSYQNPFDNFK